VWGLLKPVLGPSLGKEGKEKRREIKPPRHQGTKKRRKIVLFCLLGVFVS
jgi:hypothetical protein